MRVCESIMDAIGNTPLVRISNRVNTSHATLLAKIEFMNPGGSVKDRMVKHILSKLRDEGRLTSDTVIVENSSGNTGAALCMAAAAEGFRCVITIPDKMSREKVLKMRAFGAEVVVAPTAVEASDPRSYYSVARRLSEEIPRAIYPDQYNNPLNAQAHYESTGPEIWEQTEGKIDVFVCGMGTGGTITGVGRYLKEKRAEVRIVGVDPIGSVFHDYFYRKEMAKPHVYAVEGIGEDYLVGAIDFDVIDEIVQVTDRESFTAARDLVREEGVLCGGSSGSAICGAMKIADRFPGKTIVALLPDSGSMYLSKFLDDAWMASNGFTTGNRAAPYAVQLADTSA